MKNLVKNTLLLTILIALLVPVGQVSASTFEPERVGEDFILPTGFITPRSGVIELSGEMLEDFIQLNSIDVPEGETLVKVTFTPFSSQEDLQNSDSIDPRFLLPYLEIRNVRTRSGSFVYESSRREDLLDNFGSTASQFTRTLSASANSGYTASAQLSVSVVNAGVGFQVNRNTTETKSYTANVPARTRVRLNSVRRAHWVDFDVWELITNRLDHRGNAHRPNGIWIQEFHSRL